MARVHAGRGKSVAAIIAQILPVPGGGIGCIAHLLGGGDARPRLQPAGRTLQASLQARCQRRVTKRRPSAGLPRNEGPDPFSGLHEGPLQHIVSGRRDRSLFVTSLGEQKLEVRQYRRTATEHQAVMGGIERRQAKVVE